MDQRSVTRINKRVPTSCKELSGEEIPRSQVNNSQYWAPRSLLPTVGHNVRAPWHSSLFSLGAHGHYVTFILVSYGWRCPRLSSPAGPLRNLTYNWIGPAGQDSNASIIINSESLRINYEVYCWHYDNNFFVRPKLTTVIGKEIGRTCKKLLSTDPLSTSHKEWCAE